MIKGARLLHSAGASVGVVWLFASAASASVPYTPSTTLAVLQVDSYTFPITQINDGQKGAQALNGFGTKAESGDIIFTFAGPTDLSSFTLWNNIVVDGIGGIKTFTLEFFGAGNVSLGQSSHVAVADQAAPLTIPLSRQGVRKVRLHVDSSQDRIEIREVEFEGTPAKPPSFTMACNEVKGLGFSLKQVNVTRTSNPVLRGAIAVPGQSSTGPYSYSAGPLRAYGNASPDRVFVDSFPLIPPSGQKVCQIVVNVAGSSGAVGAADSLNIFLPKANGLILNAGTWQTGVGSLLLPGKTLTNNMGPWTHSLTISSAVAAMRPALDAAMLSGVPNSVDVVVLDDSRVTSVSVTYTVY